MSPEARAIIAKIAQRTGVPAERILSRKRDAETAAARFRLMFALRHSPRPYATTETSPTRSYPEIGRIVGRDHTCVIHGCRRHAERIGR